MAKFIFCPQCTAKCILTGRYPYCSKCNETYYRNSKPCTIVLPVREGKILLGKRAVDPHKGAYDTIGGFLEEGEEPIHGAIRETKEETGLTVEIVKLLGIYTDCYGDEDVYTLNIAYIAKVIGGSMKPQDDVAELEWVDILSFSPLKSFASTKKALKDLRIWYENQKK